jgi:hypothetical protein
VQESRHRSHINSSTLLRVWEPSSFAKRGLLELAVCIWVLRCPICVSVFLQREKTCSQGFLPRFS